MLDHAVPRPLRPARRRAGALDLRPRRGGRVHGVEGHHVRRPADGPDGSGHRRRPDRAPDQLVRGATAPPRSAGAGEARRRPRRGRRRARGAERLPLRGRRGGASRRRPARPRPTSSWRAGTACRSTILPAGTGLYMGRIWYTYPINGLQAGDFTCRGRRLLPHPGRPHLGPLKANVVRISDNITSVLEGILGATRE